MSEDLQKYYRYHPNTYSPKNPALSIYLKVRDTPKGFVVVHSELLSNWQRCCSQKINKKYAKNYERFVLRAQERPFCYETPKEAFEGFIERQIFREKLLKEQLETVGDFLNTISPQALREIRSLYAELEAINEQGND